MSNLTFVEKSKLEQLLGMETGYVLDFSNRTFAEFVRDSTGRDIYDVTYSYGSGSKANRLRAFWQKEENRVVGKLMNDMLDYAEGTAPLQEVCRLIVGRLLQDRAAPQSTPPSAQNRQSSEQQLRSRTLRQLKEDFLVLAAERDRNRAGFGLERLLNRLFDIFELRPRQPFRVVGEQIDGSFELDGQSIYWNRSGRSAHYQNHTCSFSGARLKESRHSHAGFLSLLTTSARRLATR